MKQLALFALLFLPASVTPTLSSSGKKRDDKAEVQRSNQSIAASLIKGDIKALVQHYAQDCRFLPEFRPVISGRQQLTTFYQEWMKAGHVMVYEKHSYEVQLIGKYLLETGNFNIRFTSGSGSSIRNYRGKYMTIWERTDQGTLRVYAEALGADHFVQPQDMPYPAGGVHEDQAETFMVNPRLKPELERYDKEVVRCVIAGDGNGRAAGFSDDGICLPHFDAMQIGMAAIRPYMLKTYHPNTISYVRDTFRELSDDGRFILLTGHFSVILNNPGKSGFEGNMLNLMKRSPDGKLLMYRQLAHN